MDNKTELSVSTEVLEKMAELAANEIDGVKGIAKKAIDLKGALKSKSVVKGVKVVDTYRDENGKSITARILFSHPERTLSGDEVKAVTDAIIAELSNQNIALKQ